MMLLLTDLMTGFPSKPLAGSVASSVQLTGSGGGLCRSRATHGAGVSTARPSKAIAKERNIGFDIVFLLRAIQTKRRATG
jgi:hypothetical protein